MARNEQDREDLFNEATAYSIRGDLSWSTKQQIIFVGQRSDGRFSFYFGADPVYHFTSVGQLRRAFVEGQLYRTQGTTLAQLRRNRTDSSTQLLRHDLTPDQLEAFLNRMHELLKNFVTEFRNHSVQVMQSTTAPDEFAQRVIELGDTALKMSQTLSARIPGKR